MTGILDSQPDTFYFNAFGYSGKFILDWNTNKFICISDPNIKIISPSYNSSGSNVNNAPFTFFIIVPDGHKFRFDLKVKTKINRAYGINPSGGGISTPIDLTNHEGYSSRSYKLKEITTNKGEIINFNYEETSVSKNFPNVNLNKKNFTPMVGSNYVPNQIGVSTYYFATEQPFSYLSSITYGDTEIKFITSNRIDLKESKKLDKIQIKYNNSVVNEFNFNYAYFIGNPNGYNWDSFLNYKYYNTGKTSNELTHRLKLTSFNEQTLKPYIFNYNTIQLPKKTSYATDYWGFYNGQLDNNSFFPNIYRFNIERGNTFYLNFEDNNKSPDIDFCKAATLETITYPSGGYTDYNYELHSFDNYVTPPKEQGSLESFNISSGDGNPSTKAYQFVISEGGGTIFKGGALLSTRGCNFADLYDNTFIRIEHFKPSLIPLIKNIMDNSGYNIMYAVQNRVNELNPPVTFPLTFDPSISGNTNFRF